jgi:hypothetical protein
MDPELNSIADSSIVSLQKNILELMLHHFAVFIGLANGKECVRLIRPRTVRNYSLHLQRRESFASNHGYCKLDELPKNGGPAQYPELVRNHERKRQFEPRNRACRANRPSPR